MSDVASDLQRALFKRLTEYQPLVTVIGDRVYDRVEDEAAFPYLTFNGFELTEDGDECRDGDEIEFEIDIWSRAYGSFEAKALLSLVRKALHRYPLPIGDHHALLGLFFIRSEELRDGDGLTTRITAYFAALTDTA